MLHRARDMYCKGPRPGERKACGTPRGVGRQTRLADVERFGENLGRLIQF